jgi:hypothetical protein
LDLQKSSILFFKDSFFWSCRQLIRPKTLDSKK